MRTVLDTNVLVSLFNAEPTAEAVASVLFSQRRKGALSISGQVYGELCVAYEQRQLIQVLSEYAINIDFTMDSGIWELAADRWRQYLENRRKQTAGYMCPNCGHQNTLACENCNQILGGPRRILADFTIGAHAVRAADQLVTFDRGVYETYYPELEVFDPRT